MIAKTDPKGKGVIRPDQFLQFNKKRTFGWNMMISDYESIIIKLP